jgi:AcrR family transcriptional regulator
MATQVERSAATRGKLLDATIECLSELGWSATTTTVIAERAGVSRGAQLHHFPTKDKLVLTAIDHLLQQRDAEFRAKFTKLERRGPAEAIELLWTMVSGRTFDAWLELVVAARTDAELRPAVRELTRRFAQRVEQTFRELFPRGPASEAYALGPFLALTLLEGLALDRIVMGQDPRIRRAIDLFKLLAASAFAFGGSA